jgi:type IV secretion system protein VirB11
MTENSKQNAEKEFILDPLEERYLGPLLAYMTSDKIKKSREIVINQPGEVGYELMDGSWEFVEAPELTEEQLMDATRVLASRFGLVFGPSTPVLSCKMPQGHRVQVVAGYGCKSGFSMCVRLVKEERFTIDNYNLSEEDKKAIIDAIKTSKTILVSGGTSSGKTSFTNAILHYIPKHERLITLEDVPELEVPHHNHLPLLFGGANTDDMIGEMLNACLRMRPDRIILGEIRKENAFAFCSAINTGHSGSMSTIHANNPKMAIDAVINRVMMNGDIPETAMNVLRRQLKEDIYGVIQLNRHGQEVKGYFTVLDEVDNI